MKMQGYCDFFLQIILKRTSTEAHVYIQPHQGVKVEHFEVSNLIYHKFSHGDISYTLNGETVNIMLEFVFSTRIAKIKTQCKCFTVTQYSLASAVLFEG